MIPEYTKVKVSPSSVSPIGYIGTIAHLEADAWLRIFCSQIESAHTHRDNIIGVIAGRADRAMEEFRKRFIAPQGGGGV